MAHFHFFAGERLSPAELSAACLDGDLQDVGDAYMPAGAAETTWMRARSLSDVLDDTLAATHATAAWVHGALSELPGRLDVQRSCERRRHHVPQRRLVYRDVRVHPADVVHIGGVAVTDIARTAADLARGGDEYVHALNAFLAWIPDARDAGLRWVERNSGMPRTRLARRVLTAG